MTAGKQKRTEPDAPLEPKEVAARCHEIQTGLRLTEVPEFENLTMIGMAVRLSLHIRGLPPVSYEKLRLVSVHFLGIPPHFVGTVVSKLADIEFVKMQTEGKTIKVVVPTVPYYETLYQNIGSYAEDIGLNEAEKLSIEMLSRLSKSPEKTDTLKSKLGAESALMDRMLQVGREGSYFKTHRSRGREVVLSPTYFWFLDVCNG